MAKTLFDIAILFFHEAVFSKNKCGDFSIFNFRPIKGCRRQNAVGNRKENIVKTIACVL